MTRVTRPLWKLAPQDRAYFSSTLYPLRYWLAAGRAAAADGCDVIHVFNYSQALPVLRALNPEATLVLHMQCEWLTQLHPRMLRRRLRHADLVLACSDAITRKTQARFPDLASRCTTVFNGCDAERLAEVRPGKHAPSILFVGRLSPEKGLHVLADAFNRLVERYDVGLTLVGEEAAVPLGMLVAIADEPVVRALERFYPGSYREAVLERLSPRARARVTLTGGVPYADVAGFYGGADVFVLPSLLEAFGMPAAEALAAGVPAVVTDAGGLPEVVDEGETGFVVPRDDVDALTAAIARLLEDRDLRARLGERGRERAAARFSWDVIAERALEAVEGARANSGEPRRRSLLARLTA